MIQTYRVEEGISWCTSRQLALPVEVQVERLDRSKPCFMCLHVKVFEVPVIHLLSY